MPVFTVPLTWTDMPSRPQLHSSSWYRLSHTHSWPGLPWYHRWPPCGLTPRDTQALSHQELALVDPLNPLFPGHFTYSPPCLSWPSLVLTHSLAQPHLLQAAGTPCPPSCGLTCNCWHSYCPLPETHAHRTEHPSPRKALERNSLWR